MEIGKKKAAALGVLTVLPAAWLVLSVAMFLALVVWGSLSSSGPVVDFPDDCLFTVLFFGHLAAALLVCALVAFYVVHLFRTPLVANDMKGFWAVVIFLGSVFSMPIYWRLYVWKPLLGPTDGRASSAAAD